MSRTRNCKRAYSAQFAVAAGAYPIVRRASEAAALHYNYGERGNRYAPRELPSVPVLGFHACPCDSRGAVGLTLALVLGLS